MDPISPGERASHFTTVPPPEQESLKPLKFLLLISSVLIFLLITLGGIVRVTDSGLACPDWPLCHGKFIPPRDLSIYIEYSHRLTATVVSLMLVITAIVTWLRYRYLQTVKTLLLISLGLLTLQVALGAITVLKELPPHVVTAHLGIAELIFASVILALVWSKYPQTILISPGQKNLVTLVLLGVLGTYIVIISGSYIVGNGSGPSCPSWPLCDGGIFPATSSGLAHMSHRIIAGITTLLVGYLCFYILTNRDLPKVIRITAIHIGILVAFQILVGAANPWSQFSPIFKALHLSLATIIWGGVVVLLGLLWRPRSNT